MGTIQLLPTYKISASAGNIAFDATSTPGARSNSGTTMTWAHTCTGTNRFLVVNVGTNNTCTGVTYAGTAMTQVGTASTDGAGNNCSAWILINPASGSNNVVTTINTSGVTMMKVASYTGVLQTAQPDVSVVNGPTATPSFTQTVTTTVNNDWLIMCGKGRNGSTITAGANTFVRSQVEVLFTGLFIADSNASQTPTGSKSLNVTSLLQEFNGIMFAIKPA